MFGGYRRAAKEELARGGGRFPALKRELEIAKVESNRNR
jgi:hypothetical protein